MSRNAQMITTCVTLLLLGVVANAQATPPQRPLRYVAEWEVPRSQWTQFETFLNKNVRPLLADRMNKGLLLGWGTYRSVLNQDGARTHGAWFEAGSIDVVDQVSKALDEVTMTPLPEAVKRHDYLYRSQLRRALQGGGTDGYLFVNTTQILPGQREHWREWWDKNQQPNFEQYLSAGLVTMYELVVEEIHHAGPNWAYLIYVTPSPAALDKVDATFAANSAKRTPEERRAIQAEFDLTVVPEGHQDYVARISAYAQR